MTAGGPDLQLAVTLCCSPVILQSVLEQRQETWPLGRGEGQEVRELVRPEQRARLRLRQEQRLRGRPC